MERLTDQELYVGRVREVSRSLAQPHVDAPGSRLVLLSDDPDNPRAYPWQNPMCSHVKGHPVPMEDVDALASQVKPQFPDIVNMLTAHENTDKTISNAGEWLKAGGNVVVVTSHADITDIAIALKLVGNFLYKKGYEPESAIMVSKMIAELGYDLDIPGQEPIPAIMALQLLCDDIFLSWPRTESAKSELEQLPDSEISRHNQQMTGKLTERMDEGGLLLAMAPTGTTKLSLDESDKYNLAPFGSGTIKIMQHERTKILPMLLRFNKDETATASMHNELISITSPEEANDVRQLLAMMHAEHAGNTSLALSLRRRLGGIGLIEPTPNQ